MPVRPVALAEIFEVRSGDFHATSELESGSVPLVSCGETNNGVIGTFEIPADKTYDRCLTVAYNGSWPLLTKYHPYRFGAKDDVGILVPKRKMEESSLLYVAAVLSREKWRYSYGRKCYKQKVPSVRIPLPVDQSGALDEGRIAELLTRSVRSYIPHRADSRIQVGRLNWQRVSLGDLFHLEHGDFNAFRTLDEGDKMIVSRSADNNGVDGRFEPPEGAREFPPRVITVTTVSCDAFVQLHPFYASDKVVLLTPKKPMRDTTLFFVAFAINHQQWRFSYGRSCFKRTLKSAHIQILMTRDGKPDEDEIESIVKQASYWPVIAKRLQRIDKTDGAHLERLTPVSMYPLATKEALAAFVKVDPAKVKAAERKARKKTRALSSE